MLANCYVCGGTGEATVTVKAPDKDGVGAWYKACHACLLGDETTTKWPIDMLGQPRRPLFILLGIEEFKGLLK